MNCKYLVLLIIFFYQCKEVEILEHKDCDHLDLATAKIGNLSFVSHYPKFLLKFGEPVSRIDSCASTSILYKQGFHYYDCLEFQKLPGVKFNLYKDTIFVSSVEFDLITFPVSIDGLVLSNKTLVTDVIQNCNLLEEKLNKGVSSAQFEGQDWLYIKEFNDLRPKGRKNQLEFRFEDKALKTLFYDWQPSYNLEQWSNYLITKERLDK